MGRPFSPQNLPLPMGGSEPPSNTWSLGPSQVFSPDGISIASAVFAGLISVTDRQTDRPTDKPTNHATRSLTIDRIYVPSTAMRSNNNNLTKNKQSVKETSNRRRKDKTESKILRMCHVIVTVQSSTMFCHSSAICDFLSAYQIHIFGLYRFKDGRTSQSLQKWRRLALLAVFRGHCNVYRSIQSRTTSC